MSLETLTTPIASYFVLVLMPSNAYKNTKFLAND